jgi:hypothetical protein
MTDSTLGTRSIWKARLGQAAHPTASLRLGCSAVPRMARRSRFANARPSASASVKSGHAAARCVVDIEDHDNVFIGRRERDPRRCLAPLPKDACLRRRRAAETDICSRLNGTQPPTREEQSTRTDWGLRRSPQDRQIRENLCIHRRCLESLFGRFIGCGTRRTVIREKCHKQEKCHKRNRRHQPTRCGYAISVKFRWQAQRMSRMAAHYIRRYTAIDDVQPRTTISTSPWVIVLIASIDSTRPQCGGSLLWLVARRMVDAKAINFLRYHSP